MNFLKNPIAFFYIAVTLIYLCTEPTLSKVRIGKSDNINNNTRNNSNNSNNNSRIFRNGSSINNDNLNEETRSGSENYVNAVVQDGKDIIGKGNEENSAGLNSSDTDGYINIATVERASNKTENAKNDYEDTEADNETLREALKSGESESNKELRDNESASVSSVSVADTQRENNKQGAFGGEEEEEEGEEEYDDTEHEEELTTAQDEDSDDETDQEEDELEQMVGGKEEEEDVTVEGDELGEKRNVLPIVDNFGNKEATEDDELVKNDSTSVNKNNAILNDIEKKVGNFQEKVRKLWNRTNLFRIFERPVTDAVNVNYFRNEIQNELAFRNGLYFSCTSAYLYNKHVDGSKHAYILLPSNTLVILVTANKLFFQDLIYSSNKYVSIKNKFAYLMNTIIDNLKGKIFFRNYNYQYLFRDDSFAVDPTRKLLDFDLLGELSQTTQTIYTDSLRNKKVSMHKLYGGWFQFLGIMVVNGYYHNEMTRPQPVEVVPYHMLPKFKDIINQAPIHNFNYAHSLGLWRDFPNDKFAPWRYSLELLLWDSLHVLPTQLPHPAKFILAYTAVLGKEVDKNEIGLSDTPDKTNIFIDDINKYTKEELLNWHVLVNNIVKEQEGIDVAIVAADDYYKKTDANFVETEQTVAEQDGDNMVKKEGYVLLFLLNSEFFNDKSLLEGNYRESKRRAFFKKIIAIIDKIQEILEKIKHAIDPDTKTTVKLYNYLNNVEDNYKVFNPHILGSIAGITQHLKCENVKNYKCTHDVSVHYKYGGWFEFAAALYIENVIPVPMNYLTGEILKKEYEQSILLQANSNYQNAGLWRDIPEKDTTPYRYSLQAFVLENPELNIVNVQKAHPFMIIDLINKGLQVMKKNVTNGNVEKVEDESSEKEIGDILGKKGNTVDTIQSEDEFREIEQKIQDLEKSNISGQSDDELHLNFGQKLEKDDTEEDLISAEEKETEDETLDDTLDATYDMNSEEADDNVYVDEEENEKITGSDEEGELLKTDTDESSDEFADSLKYVINSDGLAEGGQDNIEAIKNVYNNNSKGHDLNLLESEEEGSSNIQGKLLLLLLILCLTVFLSLIIYMSFKLYERFSNRKAADKNEVVLAFKDKEEIPVVHGMPAPWLKD